MRPEARKYLYDIQRAAALLDQFTTGKRLEDYVREPMMRAAVERQFGIIGEALAQLDRLDPAIAARISEHRRVIAFRNILIHGYAEVDDRIVWGVLESNLPLLQSEIDELLSESWPE